MAAAVLYGCGRQEPKKNFVARVNDSYLTSSELSAMMGSSGKNYRNEFIRKWIRREVLYQAALNEGLLDREEYKRAIENSKKELAAAMMLDKYFEEESIIYEPKDIEDYYNSSQNNLRLIDNGYLVNMVVFNDEDKAVSFRSTAIETDWNKALNVFKKQGALISADLRKLLYEKDIYSALLLKMLKELYPLETSIVLSTEPGEYAVVQVIEKFEKGTIPPFEAIKDEVRDKFVAAKKESALGDYLHELYSGSEIEIKNVK